MPEFSIDYPKLEKQIIKKAYKLNDVKDQLETVAFDIVRFKDSDKSAELWQIQSADDGDYIVALYDEENIKEASPWSVSTNKIGSTLQIAYKGDPIVRLAAFKLGIPNHELPKAEEYLPAKLAENKKLVNALLKELNEVARKEVIKRYPELGPGV